MRMQPTLTLEDAKMLMQMQSDWDWEKFRREAAKDILAGIAASGVGVNVHLDTAFAIKLADELIKQLKESNTC